MAEKTMIVMMPIAKFDRRKDAEHLENNHLNLISINELRARGAAVLALSEFMDLCNDQEIDLGGYWISYISTLSK
jgi:hypothetical protein